jgi:polyhydroxyalkanoate depolymerase
MPGSFVSFFPGLNLTFESMKMAFRSDLTMAGTSRNAMNFWFHSIKQQHKMVWRSTKTIMPLMPGFNESILDSMEQVGHKMESSVVPVPEYWSDLLEQMEKKRKGDLEFMNFLGKTPPPQDFELPYDDSQIILDLPSLRVIDISTTEDHIVENYAVVVAPRAGHHSNIAERVAVYLRDNGLTRVALVEQKCCDEIPLYVNGERHHENFDGQVEQYRQMLEHLHSLTGRPSHVVAVCQPGPLLCATVILNPHLAKTFGTAGSPMDTEGEQGFLTDFSREMGEGYIDFLMSMFGRTVGSEHPGSGRRYYDGSAHVLGFYMLGYKQHSENFAKLHKDLREGNEESAKRQMDFYEWYNTVHHFPVGFIRDTYQKVFVNNELSRGQLIINGKKVSLDNFPANVPIWALGGTNDDIAPPLQATGHLNRITSVPEKNKLSLVCSAGHMGLFRSRTILKNYYSQVVRFVLPHSDFASTRLADALPKSA